MKTAYELAMERLKQSAPSPKLTADQKRQLADLDSKYAAKIAEKEIQSQSQMAAARAAGEEATAEALEQELARERKALTAELEDKKEEVRRQGR